MSRSRPTPQGPDASLEFLAGGGACGERLRAVDWPQTPLGPPEHWPPALTSAVSICLNAQFPICIYWGEDLTLLYNDAWSPIPGAKHPGALGRPAKEVWSEIWHLIHPLFEQVRATGQGTFRQDELLPMHRHGYTEECYFDYTFSPIRGASGSVEGIFNAVTETTYRVINARRGRVLRDLAAVIARAQSAEDACRLASEFLSSATHDVPFSLLYLVDPDAGEAALVGATGLPDAGPASLATVSLTGDETGWPIQEVVRSSESRVVSDVRARFGDLAGGPWPEAPTHAVVLPVAATGRGGVAAVLVAGVSPRRALDDEYRSFFQLASDHIATAIANARAYQEARRRAEQLAELDRTKTAFFSNVSHEFRTPLTLMLGPLEDILGPDGEVLEKTRELLTTVHRNGQRLLKLVNTLLDFSRIEAGRVQASYEPTDLSAYTADLASVFRSAVEKAGLKLVIDFPPFPEPVYVDRDMWEKVVLNLLSNAFKFTLDGEIRVALRAEGGRAVLTVQDTGTGIPADELPKLFNRFHRVEGAKGRTYEGSGIGLALVQELAQLHGGEATAASVYGEGSTFTVSVPLGTAHLPSDRVAAPRTLTSTAVGATPFVEEALRWLPDGAPSAVSEREPAAGPKPVVVLADDNADMRDYVRRLLSDDYEVVSVRDGEEALEAALTRNIALVLTDVMMPMLDGFGLLKALRGHPKTAAVPVIMLSARAGEEAKVEGLEAGADDYLVKPFTARELVAKVSGTLALTRARRDAVRREEELKAETLGVLETITDGFVALDRDWRFTYVNAAAERIIEMDRGELLGKTQWELFPATIGTVNETGYRKAMGERVSVHFENYYPPFDRWFEVDVYPVPDAGIGVYFRDVTERKRAAAVDAQFRALFEQSTAGIAQTDLSGRYTLVNRRYCEIVGYPEAELLGMRMQDITHPDDLAQNVKQFYSLASGGADFVIEKRYVRKDGSHIWISNSVTAVRAADGTVTGTVAVVLDISDRREAEAALRESQERLTLAQRAASVGTWDWNLATGKVTWSEGLYLILDLTPDEITPSATAWQNIIHPDDLPEVARLSEEAIGTGGDFYAEFRARRKDGTYVWVASKGRAYRSDGVPARFLGVNYDITERKRAEERLKRMVNVDGVGVLVWALPEGRLIGANDFFLRMFGYAREEVEARVLTWRDLTPPEYVAVSEAQLAGFASTGRIGPYEKEYYRKDGSRAWMVFAGASLGDGTVVEYCIDVSDRKRAEAALREADRQKDDFIALLAHELRNPLAPLRNGIQVLKLSGADSAAGAKARDMMDRQLSHMVRLIDDLLDVSRISRNKLALRRERLRLQDVVNAAVETARPAIDSAGHQLSVLVTRDPVEIDGDLIRLSQVLSNLLTNSAKYTPPDGRIRLMAEAVGGQVVVSVSDTGIGIPAQSLPTIFDMFSQVDRSLERSTGGLGIGLALVKGLVEMHGGTVSAESPGDGQGSTFTVRLPAAEPLMPGPAKAQLGALPPTHLSFRVLVVDDNTDSAESMAMMLSLLGSKVETAHDGLDAVAATERFRPEVILMDIGMPLMNGYEATRRIRATEHGRQVTIVALTGWGQDGDRERSREAGCDGHLVKPVSLEDLQRLLSDLKSHSAKA